MMKIYFAGSIRGGRSDQEQYAQVIGLLRFYGTVLTEHLGRIDLTAVGETRLDNKAIYKRDVEWLVKSDCVVADVSIPSLGVGYEIAQAESLNKKILCLFRPSVNRRLSAMIAGNKNLRVENYQTLEDLKSILENFFKSK